MISFTVPLVPPSVNHYKKPRGGGLHGFYVTAEGRAFKDAVAIFARGRSVSPVTESARDRVRYQLEVRVVLGRKQRGDGDNFWKCIADGLVEANVIHSDARVRRWILEVEDGDRLNPRTEICVRVMGEDGSHA
jgi:Holliday junction resolvase RusA-like endonuclease